MRLPESVSAVAVHGNVIATASSAGQQPRGLGVAESIRSERLTLGQMEGGDLGGLAGTPCAAGRAQQLRLAATAGAALWRSLLCTVDV